MFIIGTIDYFAKWNEAHPVINVGKDDIIIKCILHQIIYRFVLPETIKTD